MQPTTFRQSLRHLTRTNRHIHTMSNSIEAKDSTFLHKPDPCGIETRSVSDIKLRLGLIADVQFAPKPDTSNYQGTRVRRYHNALSIFQKAVQAWNHVTESPSGLFSKMGRNPFVGAAGKPLGCMCESPTCVTKKCMLRTLNLLSSSNGRATVIPGVRIRHRDIPGHPLKPLQPPHELGYDAPAEIDADPDFPGLPKTLPPTMSQLTPSSFLIPARPLDAVLQLGDIIDGHNATLKKIAYADQKPCDKSCPFCHGTSTPLEYPLADTHAPPAHNTKLPPVTDAALASPLLPAPCPTLVRAIMARLNELYASPPTIASSEGPVVPADVTAPPEATALALASVFSEVRKTKCASWHHLIGNHELYNLHRHTLYPLFGRGVQAGSLIPHAGTPYDSDVSSVPEKPVIPTMPENPTTNPEDPYNYAHYYATPLRAESGKSSESGNTAETDSQATSNPEGTPDTQFWLIVLDAYRLSIMGTPKEHKAYARAHTFLAQHNPVVAAGKGGDFSKGLPKDLMRFVPFNGGIGEEQFQWLDDVLASMPAKDRVIVTCHISTAPASTGFSTTLWDRERLLEIFRKHPGKVCLYLSGHDHDGGYTYDFESRTHHMTVAAPIECRPGEQAWGLIDMYNDGAQVYGAGKIQDMWLSFE